ncbi:electron transfer flavoprotein subunit alpha/FixB family protein [Georgenia satyanarayanai]|uniref:electron transfer flavoprotein subunit alpha/FixB family protein n=1 Tax=Georgenia satyanarayanai TaxID=860221 RepID=UPI00203F3BAE|nr:electron transfer flavoprotein subunit alpha/FixB family protein [Georgenia satyanarayanai]MCM3661476.1 electron transfer flavoprotein subunit alpha/FixB family protein [Georgenia satyanarayanai]
MTQGPVLVVVDHHEGALTPPSTEVLTAARALAAGAAVAAVWLGEEGPGEAAREVLGRFGVSTVHVPELGGLPPQLTAVATEAVAAVVAATSPQAVLLVSTYAGKELAAGLAITVGTGAVVDADRVERRAEGVAAGKTVLGASWETVCAVTGPLPVVALRPAAVDAEPAPAAGEPAVVRVPVELTGRARAVSVVERTEHPTTGQVPLTDAQTVVVGGRGTGGDFTAVEELAELLGGAVGATRDVTDEGWREHSAQVGQTGVTVAPRLYIGVGVSGAVHHTVGMRAAQTVVAVNTDPEAPIFELADFGVVGAAEDVLPQAIETIRTHQRT